MLLEGERSWVQLVDGRHVVTDHVMTDQSLRLLQSLEALPDRGKGRVFVRVGLNGALAHGADANTVNGA